MEIFRSNTGGLFILKVKVKGTIKFQYDEVIDADFDDIEYMRYKMDGEIIQRIVDKYLQKYYYHIIDSVEEIKEEDENEN